jgi:NAD(P)-dependent dehydrogenase (short-subunit alcohol dehydrogenase family)
MKKWTHALISGAGSGLGLAFAVRLLRRGGKVSVLDLSVSDASRAQLDAAAKQGNSQWQFEPTNVTDEVMTKAAVATAVKAFGPPDLVIHSAGVVINRVVAEMTGAAFRQVIDINLNGSFHIASAVLPHMQKGSRLALIASMAGLTSNYAYAAYGASKFGVVGLATTLRYEYEPLGIKISCICPPEVKTPLVAMERAPGNANPISLAVKDIAGSLDVDYAVDTMLGQLDAGRWMIIPGAHAKVTAWAARYLPSAFFAFMNTLIRREMRKQGLGGVS